MKTICLIICHVLSSLVLVAQTGTITNIAVSQRTDGSGLVDIHFDLSGGAASYNLILEVSLDGGSTYVPISGKHVTGDKEQVVTGTLKHVIWNALESFPNTYSPETVVKIIAIEHKMSVLNGWHYPSKDLTGSNYYDAMVISESINFQSDWDFIIPNYTNNYILTGDVTGDGYLEIVTIQNSILYVLRLDGSLVSQTNVGISGQDEAYTRAAFLDDMSGDGILDIAVGYSRPPHSSGQWKSRFYNGEGAVLQEFTRYLNQDGRMLPMALIDGDIIINHAAIWSRNPRGFSRWNYQTGELLWEFNVGPYSTRPSIADINNNGLFEISMGTWTPHNGASGNNTNDSNCYTIIIDEDGNEISVSIYPGANAERKGWLDEMFFKPDRESSKKLLLFKGYASPYPGTSKIHLRELNGTIINTYDGLYNGRWNFGWADITGDGFTEIVATNTNSTDNKLLVFDHELNIKYFSDIALGYTFQHIADLTGDGLKNIVVAGPNGSLLIYNGELARITELQTKDKSIITRVISTDLNLNGKTDLIILTNQSIEVFVGY